MRHSLFIQIYLLDLFHSTNIQFALPADGLWLSIDFRVWLVIYKYTINIVAAFQGMHVSPAKHSYVWLPRKCDYQESVTTGQRHWQADGQTDAGQSDPYVTLCFSGDTKTMQSVASPHIQHYSMMPIMTFTFDLSPPNSSCHHN